MDKFIAEIFAFLLIIAVLWRYVVPPARTAMKARQGAITAQFAEAREAKEKAEADEAEFNKSVTDADTELAEILQSAESQAGQILEEFRVKAEQEAERVAERGRQQLAAERDALVRELRAQTGAQVASLASYVVEQALADDARRAATVERFLADLNDRAADEPPHKADPAEVANKAAKAGKTGKAAPAKKRSATKAKAGS